MISRSAHRRIRRQKMGEGTFQHHQKMLRVGGKLRRIEVALANGATVSRDPLTKKFVSLRAMSDRLLARLFRPQSQPQAVAA